MVSAVPALKVCCAVGLLLLPVIPGPLMRSKLSLLGIPQAAIRKAADTLAAVGAEFVGLAVKMLDGCPVVVLSPTVQVPTAIAWLRTAPLATPTSAQDRLTPSHSGREASE